MLVLLLCSGCRAPQDRTEKIQWQYSWDTDDPIEKITEKYSHPGLPNHGGVLDAPVIGQDGTVYLLRPHDHTEPKGLWLVARRSAQEWEFRADSSICNSPVVADDGTILFGTRAGLSWAVSIEGKRKWTYSFSANSFYPPIDYTGGSMEPARPPSCSQPAVAANGTSYWIGHGVYALTKDGVLLWAAEQGEDFVSVSIAMDGTVYAVANGGAFAIAPDGKERWKYNLPKSRYPAGAIAIGNDESVYLTTQTDTDSAITVLSSHGDLKQQYHTNFGETFVIGKTLIAADGTIYVTKSILNRTYAMKLDSHGQVKWTGPQESDTLNIASDGTLHICDVRDLVAVSPDGKIVWRAQLPEDPNETEAHSPTKAVTLGPNGKFYIGDFVGRLGTLDNSVGLAPSGWPMRFHDARNTSRAGAH